MIGMIFKKNKLEFGTFALYMIFFLWLATRLHRVISTFFKKNLQIYNDNLSVQFYAINDLYVIQIDYLSNL